MSFGAGVVVMASSPSDADRRADRTSPGAGTGDHPPPPGATTHHLHTKGRPLLPLRDDPNGCWSNSLIYRLIRHTKAASSCLAMTFLPTQAPGSVRATVAVPS